MSTIITTSAPAATTAFSHPPTKSRKSEARLKASAKSHRGWDARLHSEAYLMDQMRGSMRPAVKRSTSAA